MQNAEINIISLISLYIYKIFKLNYTGQETGESETVLCTENNIP